MIILRNVWLTGLIVLPTLAAWLWWDDGMWSNGALPTHGIIQTVAGCVLALVLFGVVRMVDRHKRL